MITIKQQQYKIDIEDYADEYIRNLSKCLTSGGASVDISYVRDTIRELGSFAALIRRECIHDLALLRDDVVQARNMKEQTGNDFGGYCYSILVDACKATDDCLAYNNALVQKLMDACHMPERLRIAVASNYIVFKDMQSNAKLELVNFKRMTGVGVHYDIVFKAASVLSTSRIEQCDPRLAGLAELANVISNLQSGSAMHNAIDDWSAEVNDKLQDSKNNARHVWSATYNRYRDMWFDIELRKRNSNTFCYMQVTPKRITELLHECNDGYAICGAHNRKTIDYGQDYMKILELDYVNKENFSFA